MWNASALNSCAAGKASDDVVQREIIYFSLAPNSRVSLFIWFAVVLSSCEKSIRLPLNLISFITVMTKHDYGHLWHVNIWCVMEWILYLRLFQRLMQFHCHFFRYFFHSSLGDTHLFFITDTVASTERFQNTMLTR